MHSSKFDNLINFLDATGPEALIVLAEEELVAIDLQSDDWLQINLPYLVSVHASSVTCSQYVSDVSAELWEKIEAAGIKQMEGQFSDKVFCFFSQNAYFVLM